MLAGLLRDCYVVFNMAYNRFLPLANYLPADCMFQHTAVNTVISLSKLTVGSFSLSSKIAANFFPSSPLLKFSNTTSTSLYFGLNALQLAHSSGLSTANFGNVFNFQNLYECIIEAYDGTLSRSERMVLKQNIRDYKKELLFSVFTPKFDTPFGNE